MTTIRNATSKGAKLERPVSGDRHLVESSGAGIRFGISSDRRLAMDWLHRMLVYPVRRAWVSIASRIKESKTGGGLLKLRDDVQTCGYEDVQVMWEMLRQSEMEFSRLPIRRQPFWKVFIFSDNKKVM